MTFKDRLLLAIRAIGADIKSAQASLALKVDKVAGKGLSTNDYTTAERDKLAGLESPHFRGTFSTLTVLNASIATAVAGDYADVDSAGSDAIRYIWDVSDNKWVSAGAAGSLTAAQVKTLYESNPNTLAYTPTEQAKLNAAPVIDDSTPSSSKTYSSSKIESGLQGLQNLFTPTVENIYGLIGSLTSKVDTKVDTILGKGLSTNDYTTSEKNKLASLENSHYRGTFPDLYRLEQGVPVGLPGDYADVDSAGVDAVRYIWDDNDSKWIAGGTPTSVTAAQVKELYESNADTEGFTTEEKSKLAGVQDRANHTGQQGIETIIGLQFELDDRAKIIDGAVALDSTWSSQAFQDFFNQVNQDTTTAIAQAVQDLVGQLDFKVDKVTGMGLSSNDFTADEKTKLATATATGQTSIAAAATMNIGAAPTESILIPGKAGTTNISAFDVAPIGTIRYLYNTGVGSKVLIHNATSLILPAALNITLTNNSSAVMYSLGSGNWACIGLSLASGLPPVGWSGGTLSTPINECIIKSKTVTSSTFDLSTVFSNTVTIQGGGGTTTIASLGVLPSGTKRLLINMTGGNLLFTNSASLSLPQNSDLTLQYLDAMEAVSEGSGIWRITNVQVNSGIIYGILLGIRTNTAVPPTAGIEIGAASSVQSDPGRAHIKLKPQALSTTPEEGTFEYATDGKLYWVNNLRRSIIGGPGFDRVYVNAATTGAVTLNLANYTAFDLTLTGNTTLDFSSAPLLAAGEMITFVVRLTCGATPYTISWPAGVITVWLNTNGSVGVAPAAGKVVEFVITTQNGTTAIARKAGYN